MFLPACCGGAPAHTAGDNFVTCPPDPHGMQRCTPCILPECVRLCARMCWRCLPSSKCTNPKCGRLPRSHFHVCTCQRPNWPRPLPSRLPLQLPQHLLRGTKVQCCHSIFRRPLFLFFPLSFISHANILAVIHFQLTFLLAGACQRSIVASPSPPPSQSFHGLTARPVIGFYPSFPCDPPGASRLDSDTNIASCSPYTGCLLVLGTIISLGAQTSKLNFSSGATISGWFAPLIFSIFP